MLESRSIGSQNEPNGRQFSSIRSTFNLLHLANCSDSSPPRPVYGQSDLPTSPTRPGCQFHRATVEADCRPNATASTVKIRQQNLASVQFYYSTNPTTSAGIVIATLVREFLSNCNWPTAARRSSQHLQHDVSPPCCPCTKKKMMMVMMKNKRTYKQASYF
ncbi:hypothetical protein D917_03089 [Trichinella nativa]|uniref:Uncharacterized protein n=1 Tax=Trichinella nativa TaxID=6335 RepID=A0A1Y3EGL7_9BILA|nr:hypothetical protein D917_03089 [Trichinella nativa]